jgi:VanZ family protein
MKQIMTHLRFSRFWRLLGWLVVSGVVYLSLTPFLPDLKLGVPAQDKFEHFIAYALLAWWFSQAYPLRLHGFLGLFLIALGAILEVLQGFTGYRDFEYTDMLADTLGVVGGYLLALTSAGATFRRLERFWETYGSHHRR